MISKIDRLQHAGGEAMSQIEGDLNNLKAENKELKHQLHTMQQEYSIALEKLKSLESTLANVTSGNEEMIAREKAAAEERAAQQREREIQHSAEMQELENKAKNVELKLKTDFNHAKNDWAKQEKEMKDQFDTMKKTKDREIENLRKYVNLSCGFIVVVYSFCLFIENCQRRRHSLPKKLVPLIFKLRTSRPCLSRRSSEPRRPRLSRRQYRRSLPRPRWFRSTTLSCTRICRESSLRERNCTTIWRT